MLRSSISKIVRKSPTRAQKRQREVSRIEHPSSGPWTLRLLRSCSIQLSTRRSFPGQREAQAFLARVCLVPPLPNKPSNLVSANKILKINTRLVRSASIWSPVTAFEPTRPPSQDRQSAGPRLTGAGAGGAARCVPSLRSVSETSGTWCPRRMLKSVSRRKDLIGDGGMESAVVVLGAVLVILEDKTDTAAALICEGAGEVARACGGTVGVCAVSWRGMSMRRSPVWSTEGGLMRIVI